MRFCIFKQREKAIEKLLKHRSQEEREIILFMFRYAEGKLSNKDILKVIKENWGVVNNIFVNRKIPESINNYEIAFLKKMIKNKNIFFSQKTELYRIILGYFRRQNIKGNYYNKDNEMLNLIFSAFPEWVYLLQIIEKEMPKDLDKDEELVWCKKKVLSLYQYDTIPPDWIQDANWPIYNGVPMKFTHQLEHGEQVVYYFIDIESGYKKSIIQTY